MPTSNLISLTIDLGGTAGATDGANTAPTTASQAAKVSAKFLICELPKIVTERPCWGVYEHWVTNEKGRKLCPGVYRHGFRRVAGQDEDDAESDTGDRPITDELIASPVTVVARTTNSDDGSEGRLLRLVTESSIKEWIIPMEVFGGSGEDARRQLFGMGAIIELKKRGAFMEYLLAQRPEQVFATTCRPGWHESGAFVLPGRTIGSAKVRYQSSSRRSIFSTKGDLAHWQAEVATKCAGNPVLTLAVGCALAGPLLSLVGVLGGGVHLVGDSSSGKSLAQLVAASVWGEPEIFKSSWDMTKGGLEIEASSRNDTTLILDEIKRANPKNVEEMAYALANGQGKGTMTREREAGAKLAWRVLALSSGERSLSEHAAISGNTAHAGSELRMVDVNAGTRIYKAFDELYGMDGGDFHRLITLEITDHYGHLGPAFVEKLLEAYDKPGLQKYFASIRAKFIVDSAQAGRVADRFAVIALAGEMAIDYGLLPWTPGSALADCQLLYNEWLSRVGSGNVEDRQILAGILDFINKHGSSRFSDINASQDDAKVFNRAGYWELIGERIDTKRLYLFNSSALMEAAPGYGLNRVGKALDGAGAIVERGSDRKRYAKKCRVPGGGSPWLYVIDPEALDGEGAGV